jgi:uncharacterized protein (TIGR02284 family)
MCFFSTAVFNSMAQLSHSYKIKHSQQTKELVMAIDNKQVLDQLDSLVRLDIDAVRAYTEAIDRIDMSSVKEQLTQFRSDHERHITNLSSCIMQAGGTPPENKPDVKGFFIKGFTALRSMTGNEGALKAMKGNEELTNKHYQQALELELPNEIRLVVQQNREDERRHLEYIDQCIQNEIWNEPRRTVA